MPEPTCVLVVDDEPAIRGLVGEALEMGGMAVLSAASAEEAVKLLATRALELVVSDVRMPGLGGFHLLAESKLKDRTLPVVMMTGYGDVESSVEALRLGADDFLTKPLKIGELLRVASRAVEKGRLMRENQVQKERLERLYRVKSEFLANMSHELRTPLTTIIGMSEVLADGLLGELNTKQHAYVHTVQESAAHLLGLINNVLDFSKIEAGKMTLELGEFPAAEAMATAQALVEGQALQRGIRVTVEPAPSGLHVHGDRGKVVQVLLNLLSNAVKFTPRGGTVVLRCRAADNELCFEVEDRGMGIPDASLDLIFDEFQQLHGQASGKDPGTGLGLALSRKLARMHGGDVRVASVLGQGSTFSLALPATGILELTTA